MKRIVTYKEESSGIFHISCATCPLLPAFSELGKVPEACVAGIVTNVQGHMPLNTCRHYEKDSLANASEKTLTVICNKEDAK